MTKERTIYRLRYIYIVFYSVSTGISVNLRNMTVERMLGLAKLGAPAAGVHHPMVGQVYRRQVVLGVGVGLVQLPADEAEEGGGAVLPDILLARRLKIRRGIA